VSRDPEADRALALDAAREAGALALDMQQQGVSHWLKSPGNPVTEADIAIDVLLRQRLGTARPAHGWLSEETADSMARLDAGALWVVDPIDGTRDYLRGRPGWAISIALVVEGLVALAVLEAPALRQSFTAIRGQGATLNGRPICVSGRAATDPVRLPVEPHVLSSPLWGAGFRGEAVEKPNSLALRLALVAEGRADAMIDGRTSAEWDVAAASLIVSEAGGTITDRAGQPLVFNKRVPDIAGLVAATPAQHAPMQQRLEAVLARLAARRRGGAASG
jgi:myo-inositol-1(or 4)-monophosphatase